MIPKRCEVVSVNISEKKGTIKKPVDYIELTGTGVMKDAHAGKWHRQVSMLATESIKKAEATAKTKFPPGTFAENITTQGIELHKAVVFDRFFNDNVALEVTQIGKKCHNTCEIGKKIGNCIMPVEGIFARVIKKGTIKAGDVLEYTPKVFDIRIITLSDRASAGEYDDLSGKKIIELSRIWFKNNNLNAKFSKVVIPDEPEILEKILLEKFQNHADIVFTTGSTGIGERDIAPETILPLLDKEIPGIMDMIRIKYGMSRPNALLSRSLAGVKNKTLVFALPGSPKAVAEYLEEIHKTLFHTMLMVQGINKH